MVHHIWRDSRGGIVGAAQALIKTIPFSSRGIVWINRAPCFDDRSGASSDSLLEMLSSLKEYWIKTRRMYLRIAPSIFDNSEMIAAIERCGFRRRVDSQWISARIDLTKPLHILQERLRKRWKSTLRQNVPLGWIISFDDSSESFDLFLSDYAGFLKERRYSTTLTPELFAQLQQLLPHGRKLIVVKAMCGNTHLGSIVLGNYGFTAEYLAGVICDEGKLLKTGRLLLWNAICEMKKRGFTTFDLGGCHPKKTKKGILQFKKGFGATQYSLIGEFDGAEGVAAHLIRLLVR